MGRRANVGLAAVFLLGAAGARASADPGAASPYGSLQLRDGRVLHHVRTLSDEGASVVVSSDEGMVKLDKADLPDAAPGAPAPAKAASSPQLVMEPFNPDQAPAGPVQEPAPKKPEAKPGAPVQARNPQEANPVFMGCTIASFQPKAFQTALGSAAVVFRNGTDAPVVVRPWDLVCMTSSGTRHAGRSFVIEAFPPIVRRRLVLPPQGEVDEIVVFTSEALDISGVQWAH